MEQSLNINEKLEKVFLELNGKLDYFLSQLEHQTSTKIEPLGRRHHTADSFCKFENTLSISSSEYEDNDFIIDLEVEVLRSHFTKNSKWELNVGVSFYGQYWDDLLSMVVEREEIPDFNKLYTELTDEALSIFKEYFNEFKKRNTLESFEQFEVDVFNSANDVISRFNKLNRNLQVEKTAYSINIKSKEKSNRCFEISFSSIDYESYPSGFSHLCNTEYIIDRVEVYKEMSSNYGRLPENKEWQIEKTIKGDIRDIVTTILENIEEHFSGDVNEIQIISNEEYERYPAVGQLTDNLFSFECNQKTLFVVGLRSEVEKQTLYLILGDGFDKKSIGL
jgi:hypothetical protein